jgi:hypothetical protein
MKSIILFFAIVVFVACNTPKQATNIKLQNQVSQNTVLPDSIFRFTVSFISIGSGTDKKAMQQFMDFIEQFNNKNNVKITTEKAQWGREGETDYCLKLNEIDKNQQDKFIADVKEVLKTSTLVRYKEYDICKNKRNEKR